MIRTMIPMLLVAVGLLPWATAGEKTKSAVTADERRVFELTNEERKKKEAAPLALNPLLCQVARAHSENMAKQMKMDHTLDEKSPFDRMRAAGYKYAAAGENIASSSGDARPAFVMQIWMESEGHKANILQTEYSEIGVGIAKDKDGVVYYTQVFGRPQ